MSKEIHMHSFSCWKGTMLYHAKSSVNENKVFAMNVTKRRGRSRGKAWKSGRGEVPQLRVVISPANFSLFCSIIMFGG
jgi:hypothetical protein